MSASRFLLYPPFPCAPGMPAVYAVEVRDAQQGWQVWAGAPQELQPRLPQGLDQAAALARAQQQWAARAMEGFAMGDEEWPGFFTAPGTHALAQALQNAATWQPDADHAAALRKRLHPDVWRVLSDQKRGRLIWRLGELRLTGVLAEVLRLASALPVPAEPGTPALLAYAFAWTLGRLAQDTDDAAQREAARALLLDWCERTRAHAHDAHSDAALHHVADAAQLMLADAEQAREHADALMAQWPQALRGPWLALLEASAKQESHPEKEHIAQQAWQALQTALAQPGTWAGLTHGQWLLQLEAVMQAPAYRPLARAVLLQQVHVVPWEHGHVRWLRRLLKTAELREDDALWALLQLRMEQEKQRFTSPVLVWRRGEFANLTAMPDNGMTWSQRTRAYFLRRGWRRLRRLGQLGHSRYVALATQVLLSYGDRHAAEPTEAGDRAMLLYGIMLSRSPAYASSDTRWWAQPAQPASGDLPAEPFPELWDAQPHDVLTLLRHACEPQVAAFAARVLRRNLARWGQVLQSWPVADVQAALASPFAPVQAVALDAVRLQLQRESGPSAAAPWLMALARSPLAEAHALLLQTLDSSPDFAREPALMLALLTSAHAPLRERAGQMLAGLRPLSAQKAQLHTLLTWAEQAEPWSAPWDEVLPALLQALKDLADALHLSDAGDELGDAGNGGHYSWHYARLVGLLDHHVGPVVWLAAHWLTAHPLYAAQPPLDALERLLASDEAWRFGAGVQLFAGLPPAVHVREPELLARFAGSAHAPARQAARPIVERLAQVRPQGWAEAGAQLVAQLADGLFRAEQDEGQHADVLALLQGPLAEIARRLDAGLHLRLLRARSKGAQSLGEWLLPQRSSCDWRVADWAALARNPLLAARQWALAAFDAQPQRVQAEMDAALRIFDSRWDDALDFAEGYFLHERFAANWNTALLMSLCDHNSARVRQLGRTLLERHADLHSLMDYVLQLAQHPSADMQLLVAQWLERGAANNMKDAQSTLENPLACDAAQLQRLQPYFLRVLSQVNRARQAKDRIQHFLQTQALQSPEAAALVAALFMRQLPTVAVGDKAFYIAALQAIHQRWPQLAGTQEGTQEGIWRVQALPVRGRAGEAHADVH